MDKIHVELTKVEAAELTRILVDETLMGPAGSYGHDICLGIIKRLDAAGFLPEADRGRILC